MKATLYVNTVTDSDLGGLDRVVELSTADKDHQNGGVVFTLHGVSAEEFAAAQALVESGASAEFDLTFPVPVAAS